MGDKSPGGTPPPVDQTDSISKDLNLFSPTDFGPFEVYLESPTEDGQLTNIHPMKIGRLLLAKKITDVKQISKKGRSRISIRFDTYKGANDLVNSTFASENNYKVYIPRHLTSCQGVIRDVDLSLSVEDIIANVRSSNPVLNARRLNRRVKKDEVDDNGRNIIAYEPTKTVVISFKGSVLPKTITLFYVRLGVSTYVLPVVRCTNCLRFGHNAKSCKSAERCKDCGEAPHAGNICTVKCIHCGEAHNALSPNCDELKRQQQIKQTMAYENITFFEAANKFPRKSTTNVSTGFKNNTPQLFPQIRSVPDDQIIPDRPVFPRKSSRSYAAVSNPGATKKKRTLSPGYDQVQHNELLWFPHGNASPVSTSSRSTITANSPQSNPIDISPITLLKQFKELLKQLSLSEQNANDVYSILAELLPNSSRNYGEHNVGMEQ